MFKDKEIGLSGFLNRKKKLEPLSIAPILSNKENKKSRVTKHTHKQKELNKGKSSLLVWAYFSTFD